jgi:putative transposase
VFKATKKLVNGVIKTVAKLFSPAPNSRYKSRQLATVLVDLGGRKASAEEYSKPSPDRILDRLHEVDEKSFNSAIWRLNTDLLKQLPLPHKVTLALDYKTLPYSGEEQPALVSDSRLPGTRLGVRFAMLSIVESGRTFVLAVKQVGPFTSNVRVVRGMLDAIKGLVEPRIILLDKGFFTVEVIKELQSRKLPFLMPAKRTAPIKRLCRLFKKGKVMPLINYTIKSFGNSVQVKLIFARKKTKRGWRTFAYVSNIAFKPETAKELYRHRWRIETNNREIGKFRARTTSTSMKLRRMYYSLAALLYNLWIVLRQVLSGMRSREFKNILHLRLKDASPMPSELGLGPPP